MALAEKKVTRREKAETVWGYPSPNVKKQWDAFVQADGASSSSLLVRAMKLLMKTEGK